jgi:hypothetical protein
VRVKWKSKRSEGSFKTKSVPKGDQEKSRANQPGFTFIVAKKQKSRLEGASPISLLAEKRRIGD